MNGGVFASAGFDSPEVQAQITQAFERVRAALAQFAQACAQMVEVITEAMAPIVRAVIRYFQQLRRQHLVPRAHRMTIMRRKIRRYLYMRT